MIIDFGSQSALKGSTTKIVNILRYLKGDSGCALYDDSFEHWAKETWGITFLHGNQLYPDHLTGLEMEDSTYTMLLLKYSHRK
jgi:hypothetical protein